MRLDLNYMSWELKNDMIDIILALLLGYYYRKSEEKNKMRMEYQEDEEKITSDSCNEESFGYCKENESTEDLI